MKQEAGTFFDRAVRLRQILGGLLMSNPNPNSSILAVATCLNVRFIYEAADGYLTLREAGKDASARLILRPVIETILWMAATEDQPDLLYRWISNDENEEKKVFVQNVKNHQARPLIEEQFDQRARDLRARFEHEYPSSTQDNGEIGLLCALQIAGKRTGQNREHLYHEFYRTYCQYSHATFNAKAGDWDSMHPIDDDYIAFWGLCLALLSLKNHAGIQSFDDDINVWIGELQNSSRYKV